MIYPLPFKSRGLERHDRTARYQYRHSMIPVGKTLVDKNTENQIFLYLASKISFPIDNPWYSDLTDNPIAPRYSSGFMIASAFLLQYITASYTVCHFPPIIYET